MAQTTTGMSRSGYKIEISTDGTSWTDISGQSNTVATSGGDQLTTSQNTADGLSPIVVGSNKHNTVTVTVSSVYTETAGQAWKIVSACFYSATKTLFLRFSPAGGASGTQRFTCTNETGTAFACPILNCSPPDTDSGSGEPALFSFSVLSPKLTPSTIA